MARINNPQFFDSILQSSDPAVPDLLALIRDLSSTPDDPDVAGLREDALLANEIVSFSRRRGPSISSN